MQTKIWYLFFLISYFVSIILFFKTLLFYLNLIIKLLFFLRANLTILSAIERSWGISHIVYFLSSVYSLISYFWPTFDKLRWILQYSSNDSPGCRKLQPIPLYLQLSSKIQDGLNSDRECAKPHPSTPHLPYLIIFLQNFLFFLSNLYYK